MDVTDNLKLDTLQWKLLSNFDRFKIDNDQNLWIKFFLTYSNNYLNQLSNFHTLTVFIQKRIPVKIG